MATSVTYSEFSAMLNCPRKWWFGYNQKLAPLKPSTKLDLGRVVHDEIERYLKNTNLSIEEIQISLDKGFDKLIAEHAANRGFPHKPEDIQEARDLAKSMMTQFITFSRKNDDFSVVALEEEFDIPIINPDSGEVHDGLRLMGKVDGWVKIRDHNFLLEHKTAASAEGDFWWKNLNQIDFYTYAMQRKHGVPFKGAVLNYLIKKIPAVPELLKSGELSKDKRIVTTEEIYLREIERHGLDPADYADVIKRIKDRGEMFTIRKIVYRHPVDLVEIERTIWWMVNRKLKMQHFPKNKTDQCSWMCSFKELCIDDTPEARDALYRTKDSEHQELKGSHHGTEV